MHRSYNSYNPVASKLLQKRWDDKYYNEHRQLVHSAKPMINATAPETFMHLHLKLKKLQLEEERLATIERDNRILLEKMSHAARTKGQIDNKNDAIPKSLSRGRREKELLRITRENLNMFKRISSKKSEISREQMERDWQKNLTFMDNISAFPDEWWTLGSTRRRAQSKPNTERSKLNLTTSSVDSGAAKNNNNSASKTNSSSEAAPGVKRSTSQNAPAATKQASTSDKKEKDYEDDFEK